MPAEEGSYIVPIGATHLQTALAACSRVCGIAVASDVLEGMATAPLACWSIPSQGIRF